MRATTPPTTHAMSTIPELPTRSATVAGVRKIPPPMMPPTTAMVPENNPRRRAYETAPSAISAQPSVIADRRWLTADGLFPSNPIRGREQFVPGKPRFPANPVLKPGHFTHHLDQLIAWLLEAVRLPGV